jgi:hypothetical protein
LNNFNELLVAWAYFRGGQNGLNEEHAVIAVLYLPVVGLTIFMKGPDGHPHHVFLI